MSFVCTKAKNGTMMWFKMIDGKKMRVTKEEAAKSRGFARAESGCAPRPIKAKLTPEERKAAAKRAAAKRVGKPSARKGVILQKCTKNTEVVDWGGGDIECFPPRVLKEKKGAPGVKCCYKPKVSKPKPRKTSSDEELAAVRLAALERARIAKKAKAATAPAKAKKAKAKKAKKPRKPMTAAQRAATLANLAKGRAKRRANIAAAKAAKKGKAEPVFDWPTIVMAESPAGWPDV